MNNFYNEVKYIILLFQIFATAPFARQENRTLFMQMHSFASFLIISTIFSSALFITGFIRQNSLQSIVNGLIFIGVLITHFFIVIQSYVTRRKQLQIIENISIIDELLLQKLGKCPEHGEQGKRYNRNLFTILIVILSSIVISLILIMARKDEQLLQYIFQMLYSLIVIRVRCIQIIFYVVVLRDRLKLIADQLIHIINCEVQEREKPLHQISKIGTICFSGIRDVQNHNMERLKYEQLLALKQIYSIIWDTSCLLNDCFGWSLLAIFTQYFVRLTTNGYWLFIIFANQWDDKEKLDTIVDVITILTILWLLCYGCYRCTKSVCLV